MPARFLHFWILGFALLGLFGCYAPQDEDPDIIVTLNPEFTVDLFEQRSAETGVPTFGLWVESMAEYMCGNYQIEAITQLDGASISIQLLEIKPPDTCFGAPAPARGFLPIGTLDNGTYEFVLFLNNILQNKGFLSVQNGHYELTLTEQQGVDFQNRVLESLPDNYMWGYALTPDEQDQPVAEQLIQNLKVQSLELDLSPGFYSYFTLSGTGQYFFHRSIAPMEQHKPFLRRLPGTTDAIRATLQTYRNDPLQPLEVACWSTVGRL